jgi:hypothetical protein
MDLEARARSSFLLLPSNEQPFNYGVNIVGVSYVATF